jgi:hypothetical protein
MDLLTQEFSTITFQDVVDFCNQKIVENTELDYKQKIPKDLTKHFSAMSNRYGGLIIVGVEEDPQTGVPLKCEGIVNDGKQVDRIHQFANNVRPLPTYEVRTTDEVNGKVFLIVRISEGGAPPYTSVNDPTVYLRTGNITTPLRQADADIVRDLYAKRANAETERQDNIAEAKTRLQVLLEQADEREARRRSVQAESKAEALDLGLTRPVAPNQVMAYLQPFYPHRELTLPRTIFSKINELRVTNSQEQFFPGRQLRPIARGILYFDGTSSSSFSCDQIYANGLFTHSESTSRPWMAGSDDIYLADIARCFYTTLVFGRKLYNALDYNGLACGGLELKAPRGRAVRDISAGTGRQLIFRDDLPLTIDDSCVWEIEADTHQLNDAAWIQKYFYDRMREIYWDLGLRDVSAQLLDEFVKFWQFR